MSSWDWSARARRSARRTGPATSRPVAESSVLATTSTYSASSTPEMKHLRPLSTQSSPSRRATVPSRWKFEPGLRLGDREDDLVRCRRRCRAGGAAAAPRCRAWLIMVAAIAGETTSSSSGQPAAASSSQTMASSVMPAAPAAVLGGDVDAQVAELARLCPQLVGVLAGLGLGHEVRVPVPARHRPHGVAELVLFRGLEHGHPFGAESSLGVTTASTVPGSTWAPARRAAP